LLLSANAGNTALRRYDAERRHTLPGD